MQQIVASGLAAQTCQFDRPCTNLAWCSFPGEPLSQRIHLKQPPTRIYKTAAKEIMTKIPGQHTWLAILPQLNPCKGKHGKTVKTGVAAAENQSQRLSQRLSQWQIHITQCQGNSFRGRRCCNTYRSDQNRSQWQSQRLQELFPSNPITYCKSEADS